MKSAITVENLSKRFQIGKLRHSEGTFRDLVGNLIKSPFRAGKENSSENLWALRDVSFEVKQGETLGIVGSNGAGKSTLLKILSRIIKPTGGRARVVGKVGSLLEIGTGFHQDLTGRENIFLNGAVLGMRREEVKRKFDQIVAFADLEKFLDTPVKFYSTGMYARLAFAVAAHLEPEILIIDEVLAVGDAAFQAKCISRMSKVAAEGRTVIFVSHDAASVTRLCKTGIYLDKGEVKKAGKMHDVMEQYIADYKPALSRNKVLRESGSIKNGEARFVEWNVLKSATGAPHSVITKEKAILEIAFVSNRFELSSAEVKFTIMDLDDRTILSASSHLAIKQGTNKIQWACELPLKADTYKILVEARSEDRQILDIWECDPPLMILPDKSYKDMESLIILPTSISAA